LADDGIAAATEEGREIRPRLPVDRYAEDGDVGAARLDDGLARVLDSEAALVVVDVVRLAIGQDQQEFLAIGPLRELRRRMADAGDDSRLIAGLQGRDPPHHRLVERFVELFDGLHPHPGAAPGGGCHVGVGISTGRQAVRQHHQGLLLHVEHKGGRLSASAWPLRL